MANWPRALRNHSLAYHGSSNPFDCFPELVLAPDCPLAVTFSFCGRSTSISSSFGVTELVVAASTSISSAILLMCHVDKLAPNLELKPKFPRTILVALGLFPRAFSISQHFLAFSSHLFVHF